MAARFIIFRFAIGLYIRMEGCSRGKLLIFGYPRSIKTSTNKQKQRGRNGQRGQRADIALRVTPILHFPFYGLQLPFQLPAIYIIQL